MAEVVVTVYHKLSLTEQTARDLNNKTFLVWRVDCACGLRETWPSELDARGSKRLHQLATWSDTRYLYVIRFDHIQNLVHGKVR